MIQNTYSNTKEISKKDINVSSFITIQEESDLIEEIKNEFISFNSISVERNNRTRDYEKIVPKMYYDFYLYIIKCLYCISFKIDEKYSDEGIQKLEQKLRIISNNQDIVSDNKCEKDFKIEKACYIIQNEILKKIRYSVNSNINTQ